MTTRTRTTRRSAAKSAAAVKPLVIAERKTIAVKRRPYTRRNLAYWSRFGDGSPIRERPYTQRDTLYWARRKLATMGLTIPGLLAKHAAA